MIKNLIFDFGKVLVDYDFVAFFHSYIPDNERCEAFVKRLFNDETLRLLDTEAQPLEVVTEQLIAENRDFEPEIRYLIDHFPDIVIGEMPGMRELLIQLKNAGFKLYGLTNWCSKVRITMSQYEIFQLLDGYIISSEEKVVKPEPEIYHRLFDKYGLKAEECLFADDREENIEGGRRAGMEGIVFVDAEQYKAELKRMNVV